MAAKKTSSAVKLPTTDKKFSKYKNFVETPTFRWTSEISKIAALELFFVLFCLLINHD